MDCFIYQLHIELDVNLYSDHAIFALTQHVTLQLSTFLTSGQMELDGGFDSWNHMY